MKNYLQWVGVAALVCNVFSGPAMAAPTKPAASAKPAAPATPATAPAARHITVKVEVENSNAYKDIAGSSSRTRVQHRQLIVTLDNRDKEPASDVTVKWGIFGHKMETNKLVTIKQGTTPAKIEGLSKTDVKSDPVTITGTPRHTVVTRRAVRGKVEASSKNEPATGEDYYGYVVMVFAGKVLIDEIYSHPSLKLTP